MRKSVLVATILMLSVSLATAASDGPITRGDQIVVDASTRSKVLSDYTLLTRDAIQKAWKKPLDLNTPDAVKGRVRIDYTIKRSGELEAVTVVKGSGNPEMDKSLVAAIRSAQPFRPFPEEIAARKVLVRANFIVADLPSAPVATVSQPTASDKDNPDAAPGTNDKQPIWSHPAGTSQERPEGAPSATPVPPQQPTKKYRWGRE